MSIAEQLFLQSCFDVRECKAFWEAMDASQHATGDLEPVQFLSTHPSHQRRAEHIASILPRVCKLQTSCQNGFTYCIHHIFSQISQILWVGCYSRIQQHAKINLLPIPTVPTHECDLCIRTTSSTVHSACANEWMILISLNSVHDSLLLDREFNHARICLEVPIHKKLLDSRNIWPMFFSCFLLSLFPFSLFLIWNKSKEVFCFCFFFLSHQQFWPEHNYTEHSLACIASILLNSHPDYHSSINT